LVKFQDWVLEKNVEFVTWQREKGAEGTPHLQGYFVTKINAKSSHGFTMKWIKENLNNKMHVEKRHGTHEQAVEYCNKKDTRVKGPWTLGEYKLLTEAENREDVGARRKATAAEVLKTASEGATEVELWEKYPAHMTHYHKSVKSYMMAKTLGQRQQPKIVVLYGPPGTGKSHRATKLADAVGPAYRWQSSPSGAVWFDGYDPINHKVVIMDDFKGGMPYTMLLRLLDRYPMHVEGKGVCVPSTLAGSSSPATTRRTSGISRTARRSSTPAPECPARRRSWRRRSTAAHSCDAWRRRTARRSRWRRSTRSPRRSS